jgi:hypothetical protein
MPTTSPARTAVLLLALSASACLTPPVVLAGESLPLAEALARFPEPCEAIELAAVDGAVLRGAYVPAEEGAAVVLHLFGATDSFGSRKFSQRPHVSQLRDLGLASLLVDYRGVGLSEGERSAEHLADDAWTMWQEAVRRAGGDPARVGIRATSLGTIATALLLERGARPGAITLIAPVMPETVVRRYARFEHGRIVAGLSMLLFAPVAEIDVLAQLARFPGTLLVCQSAADRFVSDAERAAFERLTYERGAAWCELDGGHYQSSVAGRALFVREKSFWSTALPPLQPPSSPEELWQDRPDFSLAVQAFPGAEARLAELLVLKRRGEPLLLTAVASAITDVYLARELAWSIEQRPYPLLPFEEFCEVLSLADPSGGLPADLLQGCLELVDHIDRLGLPRLAMDAGHFARFAQGLDHGDSSYSMEYHLGGETARMTLSPSRLWLTLLGRGFSLTDAQRVVLRLLLRSERIPERVRPESGGVCGLEVFEDGAWKPLRAEGGTFSVRLAPAD